MLTRLNRLDELEPDGWSAPPDETGLIPVHPFQGGYIESIVVWKPEGE